MIIRRARFTWTEQARPSADHANEMRLGVGASGGAYSWLNFALPFDAADKATVLSATLRAYVKGTWTGSGVMTAKRADGEWGPHDTWQTKPPVTGGGADSTGTALTDGSERVFNSTAMLQAVADGADWYGFRLERAGTPLVFLHSPDSDLRPTLEITFATRPEEPTGMSPSGGRSVSVGKPVLRWDAFADADADAMGALRVQIDPAKNEAAPAFDSGWLTATETELDLTTTAYAGLANGSATWWRPRNRDASGQESPWGEWAQFRRDNKGAVAITNPAAAPNNFVSESTPPLSAVLSGEVQTGRRVLIVDAADPTIEYYDSDRVKTAATALTPPRRVIDDNGKLYRLIWRVFDSKDREATPGDPPYTEAARDFTFNESATVDPVTNLLADPLSPRPWMRLTWNRATAPDAFTVKRDGKVIESGIAPADVLVAGTGYRFDDRDPDPNKEHDWVVQAVVNGVTSSGNPSVTNQAPVRGIWLHDRERDLEVFLADGFASTFGDGETGEWLDTLGGRSVRITQALRGPEGTVTDAVLLDVPRIGTARSWETQLRKMRARPDRPVRVAYGSESYRVMLAEVKIGGRPVGPSTNKTVSFEFRAA